MKRVLISLIAVFFTSCTTLTQKVEEPIAFPTAKFLFYSGDENVLGDLYVRKSQLKHSASGKKVTLLGMVHLADQSFYRQVQQQIDSHDLILAEGVSGKTSLSISSFLYSYMFAMYDRGANMSGLASQKGELTIPYEKYVNADVTVDELQSQSSIGSLIGQTIALPLTILFAEPSILLTDLSDGLRFYQPDCKKAERYAMRRHHVVSQMGNEDGSEHLDSLIPGVLAFRNQKLQDVLSEQIKQKDVNSILIPWGAAHLQDVENYLLKNGYETDKSEWVKVIAVNSLAEGNEPFRESRKFCLPYIYTYYNHSKLSEHNMLFQLFKFTDAENYGGVDVGYGHILKYQSFEKGSYFSLLPSLFGYPLLFEYAKVEDESTVRMLLFFEF